MVSATLTPMLRTSLPARSSENSTVVEEDEVDDGGMAGDKKIDCRPTSMLRTSSPARSLENSTVVEDDDVGNGGVAWWIYRHSSEGFGVIAPLLTRE